MALLSERDRARVKEILAKIAEPVTLHYFTQEFECESCKVAHELLEELKGLSPKLDVKVTEFKEGEGEAKRLGVDKIPAVVLEGKRVYGVRYFGVPSGYEFSAFLEDLIDASRGTTDVSAYTKAWLASLKKPVHIQVFVTPTCPYCPRAVRMAHKLAFLSDKVTADMVSANEFPHLSVKYRVMAVPKVVVNEGEVEFEGGLPEAAFVEQLRRLGEDTGPSMYT